MWNFILEKWIGLEEWVKFPIFLQSNFLGPKKEQVGECVTGLHITHQHQSLQEEYQ